MAEEKNTAKENKVKPLPKSGGRTVQIEPKRKGRSTKSDGSTGGGRRISKSRDRRGGNKKERSEFDNKLLDIRRVTRVVAGGRRFSFAVSMVIGDRRGRVGIGTGKSTDTPLAIEKAIRDAKRNMIKVSTNKDHSIPHEVSAKYASAVVSIIPTKSRSITAGSALRQVLELAGIVGVTGKILSRSKNKTNISRATIKALKTLKSNLEPREKSKGENK